MLLSLFDRPPFRERHHVVKLEVLCPPASNASPAIPSSDRDLDRLRDVPGERACRRDRALVRGRTSILRPDLFFDVRADVLERGFVQRRFFLGRLGPEVDDPHVPRSTIHMSRGRRATSRPLYKGRTTSLLGRPLGLVGSANHRRATSGKDTESVPYKKTGSVSLPEIPLR